MVIKVTDSPVDANEARAAVQAPSCGAIAIFEGTIRSSNEGKNVAGLEYEIHEPFLRAEVKRIADEIQDRWPVHEVALIQRVGKLGIGETGIVVAVSSAHRHEALAACQYMIDQFKKRAPVWKKEDYGNEYQWVNCQHLG